MSYTPSNRQITSPVPIIGTPSMYNQHLYQINTVDVVVYVRVALKKSKDQ